MAGTNKTIAMLGSAAAVAFAVGFAGVGVIPLGTTTAPTPHPAVGAAPVPATAAPLLAPVPLQAPPDRPYLGKP
jgi:hypothetical protein